MKRADKTKFVGGAGRRKILGRAGQPLNVVALSAVSLGLGGVLFPDN